jgi:hypothetical protein
MVIAAIRGPVGIQRVNTFAATLRQLLSKHRLIVTKAPPQASK